MIDIVSIDTPSLGDRGYLVSDGTEALVIDAQRDFGRVLDQAVARHVPVTHVFETHIHNDYVTGGLALARSTGAAYHVNAADPVSFPRDGVADGTVIEAGTMRIRVIGTPGHTFTHLAYVLSDGGEPDRAVAVFTGGSLLNGSTGRPDLLGAGHAAELAGAQHDSARRLAAELPDDTAVCPTHGFGSFCSASPTTGSGSTIGAEKLVNPALTLDREAYVATLLAGLDAYPAYYAHMSPANSAGPPAADLTPPRQADPAELRRRIDAGEWVVDLRSRTAFAAGHLRGSLHFELADNLVTYLGWLIPWGTPLTLIGQSAADVAAAQLALTRIGIDELAAAASGPVRQWAGDEPLQAFPVASFGEFAGVRAQRPVVLLDVRRDAEWRSARISGAVHIPLHDLAGRAGEIPDGQVWVHCQAGYRASVAASLLQAAGRDVVLIDDDFGQAERSGLTEVAAGETPAC